MAINKYKKRRHINSSKSTIIVIEQPELHLHPRMQFKIGQLFCKGISTAKSHEIDLKIILETHSKEIIDAIGNSIEENLIKNTDVNIFIIDKKQSPNAIHSNFDSKGYLINWPYGFFNGS